MSQSVLRTLYFVLAAAIFSTTVPGAEVRAADSAAKPDNSDAVAPTDHVIKLFDGRSWGDWYTWLHDTKREDPRKVFTVENGMIHISGDGYGCITTHKRYRDYHMVVEFKFGERTWHERENATRDSGVLIHSNGRDGGYEGNWMPSIEVQVIEGGVGDFIIVGGPDENGKPMHISLTTTVADTRDRAKQAIYKPGGKNETFQRPLARGIHAADSPGRIDWYGRDPDWKDVKGFRGRDDVESPHGQWTRLDVICDGGRIETFVNGTKVNEAFDVTPHAGRIQLQSELAEVFYRRWELWPIDKAPKPAPAKQ